MYEPGDRGGLWGFGTWVNGGHWSTCEARMIMAYYRLGKHEDARRSMKKMLDFARRFRMDNPLVDFGNAPYQPGLPINCVYDNWGVPAAMVRGLFEYLYRADGLTIVPHIPAKITRLEQHFPIRFGLKRLYLATAGQGKITGVSVNGKPWKDFTAQIVQLPYEQVPDEAVIQIVFGDAKADPFVPKRLDPYALPADVVPLALPSRAAAPVAVTNQRPLANRGGQRRGKPFPWRTSPRQGSSAGHWRRKKSQTWPRGAGQGCRKPMPGRPLDARQPRGGSRPQPRADLIWRRRS